MMEEFTIFMKNNPGELARVCDVLYRNCVNIEAVSSEGTRKDGTIKIVTNDTTTTKRALEQARIPFETKEVLLVKVLNRPGELAKLTKKLGSANINIESVYLLENGKFVMRVNDMNKSREILKEDLLE